ncbi:uncharacterized protein LOC141899836 [Tubulanus polymorphus]|uniref:uncharacterized protein LOC141899836 n=1 Tax=Tubulanus polymorphus TaxID=672921 RepID=UPI003DA55454
MFRKVQRMECDTACDSAERCERFYLWALHIHSRLWRYIFDHTVVNFNTRKQNAKFSYNVYDMLYPGDLEVTVDEGRENFAPISRSHRVLNETVEPPNDEQKWVDVSVNFITDLKYMRVKFTFTVRDPRPHTLQFDNIIILDDRPPPTYTYSDEDAQLVGTLVGVLVSVILILTAVIVCYRRIKPEQARPESSTPRQNRGRRSSSQRGLINDYDNPPTTILRDPGDNRFPVSTVSTGYVSPGGASEFHPTSTLNTMMVGPAAPPVRFNPAAPPSSYDECMMSYSNSAYI